MSKDYYRDQVNSIEIEAPYVPTLKIFGANGTETKHLSLNSESIPEIIGYLASMLNLPESECPECGDHSVNYDNLDAIEGEVRQMAHCTNDKCQHAWDDRYILVEQVKES